MPTSRGFLLWLLLTTACLVLGPMNPARGQNASWILPEGGHYEDTSMWIPSIVPLDNYNLVFGAFGAYNIGFSEDHAANDLIIANNVDLTLSSVSPGDAIHAFSLAGDASITSALLTLGDPIQGKLLDVEVARDFTVAGGDLTLINGAQLTTSTAGFFANRLEGAGANRSQVEVRGTDSLGNPSRWQSGGSLAVGSSGGAATLRIADGGQVQSNSLSVANKIGGGDSVLEVHGVSAGGEPATLATGTTFVGITTAGGDVSKGTVSVTDGAMLSSGNVQVTYDSQITIKGEDASGNPSRWQAGSFSLSGGFLDLLDGGQLSSDFASLHRLTIANVKGTAADGTPSTWNITGSVNLGSDNGFGSLLIDQGVVTAGSAQIGRGASPSSLLQVKGLTGAGGRFETTGDVAVGGSLTAAEASGELRLANDHALVDIGGTLTIWGPGTVVMHGGTLRAAAIDHTHGGTLQTTGGRLSVDSFAGNLVNNSFTLAPGDELGGTLINGNYTQQSGGELSIDIGGTSRGGTYDEVTVTGDAIVDGLLCLTLANGFTPDAADKFIVMAADSILGLFDNVTTGQRLDTTDGRGSFIVNYGIGSTELENRIVLTGFMSSGLLPGDYNGDDIVNLADYAVWRNNLGAPAGTLANDLHNSVIGAAQYDTWKQNFGLSLSAPLVAAQAARVPEPGSLAVVGLAMVLSLRVVSFRRRLAD